MPSRLRILYVEDHEDIARAVASLLKASGHEVYRAESVAGAVNLCRVAIFDVLLTDFLLPDGTGSDVLHSVPPMPAVLLTAYDDGALDLSIRRSFRRLLRKPAELPELLEALADATSGNG